MRHCEYQVQSLRFLASQGGAMVAPSGTTRTTTGASVVSPPRAHRSSIGVDLVQKQRRSTTIGALLYILILESYRAEYRRSTNALMMSTRVWWGDGGGGDEGGARAMAGRWPGREGTRGTHFVNTSSVS